ncbi:GIY-YIG nuclease family protein [Nocardiopsis algeriensis]|uniref:Bacteriophage T5 Orf172 DNA-binding domain-containing protein n=1 Tax=Nocardiopsis algeriensis TaxID=1478215 RepID=A0A841IQA4_9ACTN|nr:GIY-YIG nuclease family protein [Nocardiopsis algeriensis]MBB6119446.1 hypothetical protein [Nocardiopsis algeriensis]
MEPSQDDTHKVHQKWGFGMSPIKPATKKHRDEAANSVLNFLKGNRAAILGNLDDISTVQGLFTRTFKRDQWDWFTTWSQLDYPDYHEARHISGSFKALRRSLRDADRDLENSATSQLIRLEVPDALDKYLHREYSKSTDSGFIYILSTREMPNFLKIGYTNRDIFTRVNEINSSTGVVIPYGARAAWRVTKAKQTEHEIHSLLGAYRIRKDREFFNVPLGTAVKIIDNYVKTKTKPRQD